MKRKFLLAATLFTSFFTNAQLVPCRPKICMINYHYHNDASSNADMSIIQTIKPDFLVDNTPGGYWGQMNGGTGCLPSQYTSYGIQVFSYITSGYEGTKYGTSEDALASNLSRITAIANDGAAGVFLDEVDHHPNAAGMNYLTSIHNACIANNLLLIINPGVTSFDTALMSRCDYIMTDEQYSGTRQPINQEILYRDRVIVVAQNITSDASAANITLGARDNGFGFSYTCDSYIVIPSYLSSYMSLATKHPDAPTITQNGSVFHSSAPFGNQWYGPQGMIAGGTNQNVTPGTAGYYYSIVTLQGCSSDTSNKLDASVTGIPTINNIQSFEIFPNPARDFINVNSINANAEKLTLSIFDVLGRQMKTEAIEQARQQIFIGDLPNGIYSAILRCATGVKSYQLIIQN